MEEQKNVGKEVKMKPAMAHENVEEQKLTYEQLNQACADMSQQLQNQNVYIQKMHKQMQQMDFALQTKRMDYLFKVLEIQNQSRTAIIFSNDFCFKCAKEIEESLTVPEEQEETDKEK